MAILVSYQNCSHPIHIYIYTFNYLTHRCPLTCSNVRSPMSSTSSNGSFERIVTIFAFFLFPIFGPRSISKLRLPSLPIRKFADTFFSVHLFWKQSAKIWYYHQFKCYCFLEGGLPCRPPLSQQLKPPVLPDVKVLCTWSSSLAVANSGVLVVNTCLPIVLIQSRSLEFFAPCLTFQFKIRDLGLRLKSSI